VVMAEGAHQLDTLPDPTEAVKVKWLPLEDFPSMMREGVLTDGPSITALGVVLAFRSEGKGGRGRLI
jgi:hypothetical protein